MLLCVCINFLLPIHGPARYNWNIVESGVKHHKPKPNSWIIFCKVNNYCPIFSCLKVHIHEGRNISKYCRGFPFLTSISMSISCETWLVNILMKFYSLQSMLNESITSHWLDSVSHFHWVDYAIVLVYSGSSVSSLVDINKQNVK